jgi:hypothetical protein
VPQKNPIINNELDESLIEIEEQTGTMDGAKILERITFAWE